MSVYILIILFFAWFYARLYTISDSKLFRNREDYYCWILYAILIFISAFRGETVGADTPGYMYDYLSLSEYSFKGVLSKYVDYEGFYISAWVCNKLGMPLQLWLGLVSATYIIPVGLLIRRFSKDKLFGILCFLTMGAFSFSLAGLKQTVAMGFLILGFLCITDKRIVLGIIFSIWAYFCHKTSLVFLLLYPFYFLRKAKASRILLVVICVMVLFFARSLLTGLLTYMDDERYMSYLESERVYSSTTFIFYLTLLLISFIFQGRQVYSEDRSTMLFLTNVSILCVVVQTLSFISASAFRISLFFLPFFGIYISNALHGNSRNIVRYLVMAMVIFFFLYTGRKASYHFIWEGIHVEESPLV